MKTKTAQKKKISVTKAKEKAWTAFSKNIRLRDCLLTTGTLDRGKCFTCDREYPIQQLQAGHYIQGRGAKILFIEDNVHAQCAGCNLFKNGNLIEYRIRLVKHIGENRVRQLEDMRHETGKWSVDELLEKAQYYKELTDDYIKYNS